MIATEHPVTPEEVMAFLDGELSAEQVARVAQHLQTCSECQEIAAQFQGASHRLLAWAIEPSSADFSRLLRTLAEDHARANRSGQPHPQRKNWFRQIWFWRLATGLTVASLLIAVGSFMMFQVPRRGALPPRGPAPSIGGAATSGLNMGGQRARPNGVSVDGADAVDSSMNGVRSPVAKKAGTIGNLPINGRNYMQYTRTDLEAPRGVSPSIGAAPVAVPMIARTASLSLVAQDFSSVQTSVEAISRKQGGYVAELTLHSPKDQPASLSATLRVPDAAFTETLGKLRALGRVAQETQGGEDVSAQHRDLVARLKNSREAEQRLAEILRTRTGKLSDVLAVERELARVRGEIEQTDAERKDLEKRVDYSIIELQIVEEYKAQMGGAGPSFATRLRNSAVEGLRTLTDSLTDILLWLVRTGPALLFWLAILFWPARFLWRRLRAFIAAYQFRAAAL